MERGVHERLTGGGAGPLGCRRGRGRHGRRLQAFTQRADAMAFFLLIFSNFFFFLRSQFIRSVRKPTDGGHHHGGSHGSGRSGGGGSSCSGKKRKTAPLCEGAEVPTQRQRRRGLGGGDSKSKGRAIATHHPGGVCRTHLLMTKVRAFRRPSPGEIGHTTPPPVFTYSRGSCHGLLPPSRTFRFPLCQMPCATYLVVRREYTVTVG